MSSPHSTSSIRLSFPQPDDWHVHLRDGAMLEAVVPDTARFFRRAIVMPNLTPPITTARSAAAYRERILAAVPGSVDFDPLMTCYLTDETDRRDLLSGHQDGIFTAAKLYPAGATTNSAAGVTDIRKLDPVLETMSACAMPLLIHGEVVDPGVDIFDREAVFIEAVLEPLRRRHPELRVVLEHITTADAVAYINAADSAILAATITPHHLVINRNAMLVGGIRPHMYCLPVAKRERHRLALVDAACSDSTRFFLGTDSAPHPISAKEQACGCAGIYNSPTAVSTYLEVFHQADALARFEHFACRNGAAFYGLGINETCVTFERRSGRSEGGLRCADGEAIRIFTAEQEALWEPV